MTHDSNDAHACILNIFLTGPDLSALDWICRLTAWDLQVQIAAANADLG